MKIQTGQRASKACCGKGRKYQIQNGKKKQNHPSVLLGLAPGRRQKKNQQISTQFFRPLIILKEYGICICARFFVSLAVLGARFLREKWTDDRG